MSIERDCASCSRGEHDRHNPSEGRKPGLIGGTHCGCSGDCAERFGRAAERFLGWVKGTENFDPPTDRNAALGRRPREAATMPLDGCWVCYDWSEPCDDCKQRDVSNPIVDDINRAVRIVERIEAEKAADARWRAVFDLLQRIQREMPGLVTDAELNAICGLPAWWKPLSQREPDTRPCCHTTGPLHHPACQEKP